METLTAAFTQPSDRHRYLALDFQNKTILFPSVPVVRSSCDEIVLKS
ncbi:MAG: hypothetical protein M1368_04865 [Thaumarchaeota archaeon]|nr:hypothetical protein [Nitrososphaerota archaeon]